MRYLQVISVFLFCVATAQLTAGGNGEPPPPSAEELTDGTWSEVVERARGETVFFHMWGGSEVINRFVRETLAVRVGERYDIELRLVPVADASVFVQQVLGERQAGLDAGGSVDLMWINGENFRTMREADLLFGPYSGALPNMRWVATGSPAIEFDFGYPVDGYESPYGTAQFALFYDSAAVANVPTTISALLDWIRANPGRFTYPAPPDFTGSAFVRHLFYHEAGGVEALLRPFDQETFDSIAQRTWRTLNELEPYLWRQGRTYPDSRARLSELYAQAEVDFDMAYNPFEAASLVAQGRYPESTRPLLFEEGTIANTHFVAIPYNASSPAAAMVVANALLDPEVQLIKADPAGWGDLPAIDPALLEPAMRERFAELPRPVHAPSAAALAASRLPELTAAWLEAIENGWQQQVLQR